MLGGNRHYVGLGHLEAVCTGGDKFVFIVIDKSSLDVGIYRIKESFIQKGREKLQEAISTYKRYFIEGEDLDSYTIIGELE